MVDTSYNSPTKTGMLGGTLLTIVLQVNWTNVLDTILVAAVGAATSFVVSVLLRFISRKIFRK